MTVEEACEWCTRAVHESGTSGADGTREVHEITWQACPEWDEVSSELDCRTSFTMHLDSTFLGVHLDSTFLSSGLDLAKLELRSSW